MTQKKYYIWQCGHKTRIPENDRRTKNLKCPVCKKGNLMAVQVYCFKCGINLGAFKNSKGVLLKYCDICCKEAERERATRNYHKRKKNPHKKSLANH